ncbi:Tol-Pal system beta propeller repeat protein TolB [hydrothermal vent metagenome]|uniref:Tol-Pal system beta propeller repeat protein TolB n=1 Tax=hydrothermal vent metagenome TaxID=652676 RepID=A0A3B0R5Q8_9ZZZZ
MKLQLACKLVVLVLVFALAKPAFASLEIDITRGHLEPTPLAIPAFTGSSVPEREIGEKIAEVIRADLERSGLFVALDPASFIEHQVNIDMQPRFADWRVIKADALLSGRVVIENENRVRVDMRLWDVFAESHLFGQQMGTTPENWRRIAHKIADSIYQKLTGESGYFDTRVVFIAESGPKIKRVKRLAIMDQDGANPAFLTPGSYTVLTPRFSPTAQQITYLSYASMVPSVFLFNIETGRQEVLGDFPGMTFSPRFSPDGKKVIMSLVQQGNSDIWLMDLRTRRRVRLTSSPAIDTSPSFSPDGSKIVFNSDRGGSPQLYMMNVDGSNTHRISFGQGRYSAPVWSPRGDLIAFTKQFKGQFHIGVMRPAGEGERILTTAYLDEGPTWSPNGRVLMFTREPRPGAGPRIWSIDLTGANLRRVITPGDSSDPAWSPLIE